MSDAQPVITRPPESAPLPARDRHAWRVTWHGVRTVARLELRQRVRSTRWIWSLVAFFVVVGVVSVLTWYVADSTVGDIGPDQSYVGRSMFGFIVFFVLFLGMVVSPTLSATSINGDRAAGTLATLQVTLLSPAEIVLGKLLAAWVSSLAFLAVSVPFVVWAFSAGGTPPVGLLTTLLLLALVLAVVCAVGLGFSSLTNRTAGSAVLTYVSVAGLTVVSLIVFGLSIPLVSGTERVEVYGPDWSASSGWEEPQCTLHTEDRYVAHTERVWWLLAVNPFVVVADAMPTTAGSAMIGDPMSAIKYGVRAARLGAQEPLQECWDPSYDWDEQQRDEAQRLNALPAVWPWGLGFLLLLGAGGTALAVRRLTIPQGRLPRGQRVA